MYKILEQNGIDNENIDGSAFNNFSAGNKDGIMGGILSECSFTSAGNAVSVGTGVILIHGFRVKITALETIYVSSVPLTPTRYQIIAQIILQDSVPSFLLFAQVPQTLIQQELFENNNGTYQIEIGRFTHNPDGTITDIAKTVDTIYGGGEGTTIEVGNIGVSELDPGMPPEVDIDKRKEGQKEYFDFEFAFPKNTATDEGAVHFNEAQSLSEQQKTQARENIGAASTTGNYQTMTVGNATNAECDGDGNVIADTYAKQSGTYPNMTVGNATNAQKLGNVDVSQYAQKTGMYPNMTVGNAQFAKSLANSLYVRQSATGWYKIAEFTITGSNYNVLSTIILVNGIYGTQTSGDVEESGLLEFDVRKNPDGILYTDCFLSILAGNLRTDRFAFNISGNTASLYWYQDFEYSSVKFTILDSKAENDDECSYKLVTIPNGGFPTGGEYAHNVAKAESDSAGNSISSIYTKKSAFNLSSTHISSFLSGVSGWGDIYLSGKLGICIFSISLSSRVNAWTDKYIFNWSTIPAMYRTSTGTVFGFLSCDSNDAWMQAGICACDSTGVKINGQSHSLDSGRALVGTLVYIAQNSV